MRAKEKFNGERANERKDKIVCEPQQQQQQKIAYNELCK